MNIALAICAGIALSATVYQVMRSRLRAAQADLKYYKTEYKQSETKYIHMFSIAEDLEFEVFNLKADRDQLAQALKEAQYQLNTVKVTRDPKTGRMVSAKK